MKICIIGSGGFLSTKLVNYLIDKNHEISLIGRRKPKDNLKIIFHELDLLKKNIHIDVCSQSDVIIYTAGLGVYSGKETKAEDIFTINTFVPIHLIQQLKKFEYRGKLMTFGSYFEIGTNNDFETKFTESEIISSLNKVPNDYCLSKRLLSKYLFDVELPFTYFHCILPTIYGKGENTNRLIPYLINSIIEKKQIQLTAGNQIRQYLLIDDAVKIILDMLNSDIESGIYNFPSAETISVKEIVKVIHDSFKIELNHDIFGQEKRKDELMPVLRINSEKISEKIPTRLLSNIKNYILDTKHTRWD